MTLTRLVPVTLVALTLMPAAALAAGDALRRCRALTDSVARLSCYDAIPLGAATANAARPSAPPKETPAQFGLTGTQRQVSLDAVESRIAGNFEGWSARSRIRLENGQVWQIDDDSRAMLDLKNPKARVRRGALGAFYLEVEGTNRSPRVKRVE